MGLKEFFGFGRKDASNPEPPRPKGPPQAPRPADHRVMIMQPEPTKLPEGEAAKKREKDASDAFAFYLRDALPKARIYVEQAAQALKSAGDPQEMRRRWSSLVMYNGPRIDFDRWREEQREGAIRNISNEETRLASLQHAARAFEAKGRNIEEAANMLLSEAAQLSAEQQRAPSDPSLQLKIDRLYAAVRELHQFSQVGNKGI